MNAGGCIPMGGGYLSNTPVYLYAETDDAYVMPRQMINGPKSYCVKNGKFDRANFSGYTCKNDERLVNFDELYVNAQTYQATYRIFPR